MNVEATFIGIDLGAFKTSVTCSNGRREMLPTAVGRPKDHVAAAKIGRDVVFGSEIRRRRLILDVVRPFEHGLLKYKEPDELRENEADVEQRNEAARLIVAHAVSLMQPQPGTPVFGVIGSPSRASTNNKQSILQAARPSFDAVAVVPEPFAAAFSMGDLDEALVVDIGAGTIDICPVFGKYPTDDEQVTLGIAGDAIDERLHELLTQTLPDASLPREMVRDIKEKHGFAHDTPSPVLVELPADDGPREFDLTEPLREACRTIIVPIVDGIREVLRQVDPEYRDVLRRNILLAGGGSQLRGLDQAVERQLAEYGGGSVRRVHDSAFAGAAGALKLAMAMPAEKWEHIKSLGQLVPAA
jgi:rod shape-determining protein MreB